MPAPALELAVVPVAASAGAFSTVRVRVGTLDLSVGGSGLPALFEKTGFRILLHLGGRAPVQWLDEGPTTQPRTLKYSRVVSKDGDYGVRVSCEFDEAIDLWLPQPAHGSEGLELSADVWLEKRTLKGRLDGALAQIGLGGKLPEYERSWLGRAVCRLPPPSVDVVPQSLPVLANTDFDGPQPKALTLGVEWVEEEKESDDEGSGAVEPIPNASAPPVESVELAGRPALRRLGVCC